MSDTESIAQPDTPIHEVSEPSHTPTTVKDTDAVPLAVKSDGFPPQTTDSTQIQTPTRHPTLFFDDGNLMVVAENTMYQVHRSVLARKSALFKDLLSLPQPDTEEKVEGLPVVRLLESSTNASMLIDTIYNGEKYRWKEEEPPAWPTVHRLLVVGTKYQMDDLREEAIQHLHRRYPKKIVDWDETCTDSDPSTPSTILVTYPIEEDLSIANVARAMDLPDDIRLAALYGCCSLPFETLVGGRTLEDGTRERLCEEDLLACLHGKEKLLAVVRPEIRSKLFAPDSPPDNCRTPGPCKGKTTKMLDRYCTTEVRQHRLYDPLHPDDEIEKQCSELGLCHNCIKFYIRRHATLRQEIRSNLGKYITPPPKP
ncbi:hypothetical protein BDW22DRAFT_1356532 [Trametopsis cervina]|nr:hypothetical protein BDW22DRAFT_1356532 [Trametopsis cervina]